MERFQSVGAIIALLVLLFAALVLFGATAFTGTALAVCIGGLAIARLT